MKAIQLTIDQGVISPRVREHRSSYKTLEQKYNSKATCKVDESNLEFISESFIPSRGFIYWCTECKEFQYSNIKNHE